MIGGDENLPRRGLMFVLSSPSGAGKTTLAARLLAADNLLTLSVSATTRAARPGEVHGRDYFFVSEEEFFAMRERREFLEWAYVFGNYYGTPKQAVIEILERGCDVLLDIDWQGAQQLHQHRDKDVVSIFILPPSMTELESRLRKRAQDTDAVIQGRLEGAADEITHWAEYDYVLLNDDFDATAAKMDTILRAERLKRFRQTWLTEFVGQLLSQK